MVKTSGLTNQQQYDHTCELISQFEESISTLREREANGKGDERIHPILREANIEGMESLVGTLREQLRTYEREYGLNGHKGKVSLYGPVTEDLILVEDLLESTKDVEIPPLRKMLDHALEARGKRLRPALVLLAGTFGEYDLNRLVPLGAAIELLHTASLVHDDVVDGAESRRGRPTANHMFDNALTVLLGDYMFANAAEMVTRTGSLHVTRLFALALMKMTSGELDQDAASFDVSKDVQHYLWRIGGKTAALFSNATEGGAHLAGLDAEQVDAMRQYGWAMGMAFQIVDDILDFNGDEVEMGKPVGSDLREGTITMPAMIYMEQAGKDNAVKRYILAKRNRHELLQTALAAVCDSGGLEKSMDLARDYVRRAESVLAPFPETEAKRTMLDLGEYILTRRS